MTETTKTDDEAITKDLTVSKVSSSHHDAKKNFSGSSIKHEHQYMMKVNMNMIRSFVQSYVSKIFTSVISIQPI